MNRRSISKGLGVLALLVAIIVPPFWHIHVIDRHMLSTYSDLLPRWVGTRAALHGKDPYSAEVLREIQNAFYGRPLTAAEEETGQQYFLYPANIVLILSPLAPFSWKTACLLFMAVVSPLIGFSFWLCFRMFHLDVRRMEVAIALIAAFCSWPVMWGLRLQQPTLLAIALVFVACYLLTRNHAIPAGILLSLTTFKPQIVLPLIAWLLLWACAQKLWSFLASLSITSVLFLLATERIVPGWIPHWIAVLQGYRQATNSGLPLENLFGYGVGLSLTIAISAAGAFLLWHLRKCHVASMEFGYAVSLALAVSAILTPSHFTMLYNHVLLLPACLLLIYRPAENQLAALARGIALIVLGMELLLLPISVFVEIIFGPKILWDKLPLLNNSVLPPVIALALVFMQFASMRNRSMLSGSPASTSACVYE